MAIKDRLVYCRVPHKTLEEMQTAYPEVRVSDIVRNAIAYLLKHKPTIVVNHFIEKDAGEV